MGYPQPKTSIHVDNTTVIGIINSTIKYQQSHTMEMCYFWLLDQECQNYMDFEYHPGLENMGDYHSKDFLAQDMLRKGPMYVHTKNPQNS